MPDPGGGWTGETGAAGDDYVSEAGVGAGATHVEYNAKHPKSTYNTMYPYNKTFQSESGHLVEHDDTPSAERIRHFHKSGSYHEDNFQGSRVHLVAGHHFQYHKGGHTHTIDQNHDEKQGGHHREVKSGDHYTEHNGNKYESTMGDHINAHKGNMCQMTGGSAWHKVQGDHTFKVDGDHNHSVGGNTSIKSNNESLINSVGGDHTTNCKANYNNFAGGNVLHTAGGNYTITANGAYLATVNTYSIVTKGDIGTFGVTITGNTLIKGNLIVTGIKNFAQDHPDDSTKQISYSALEGGEVGTYCRGVGTLLDGTARVALPEHFSFVTESENLTIQLTPRDTWLQLYVANVDLTQFVVEEAQNKSGTFDYLVQGVRKGYAQYEAIREKPPSIEFKEYNYRGHNYIGRA